MSSLVNIRATWRGAMRIGFSNLSIGSGYRCPTANKYVTEAQSTVIGTSLLCIMLLLAGCTSPQPLSTPSSNTASTSPNTSGQPSITASPNPVPSGPGSGQTTIIWNTGGGSTGQVYLSENAGPEILFAGESAQGAQDAPWISAGKVYEFRLYAGTEHKQLLSSARVERSKDAVLMANPNPVPPGAEPGKAIVSWSTGDGRVGEVYVSIDNGAEVLFARDSQGSQEADWISTGKVYEFRLYAGREHKQLLSSVRITRNAR